MPITKLRPSYTLQDDCLEQLKALFPEAFADGALDWDALRDLLGAPLKEGDEAGAAGPRRPGSADVPVG